MEPSGDQKRAVRDRFEAASERYAASPVHAAGVDLERMLEEAALRGGERVLDLGCGPGHTALAFAERGCDAVGLDLSEAMLAAARRLAAERGLDRVEFRCGDVEAIPFPPGSFQVVTSRFSAHHYPDPHAALREAARVLQPGGLLLLTDSTAPTDPAQDTFFNTFELERDPSHVRNHSVDAWIAMAGDVGLRAHCVLRWELELDFAAWIERNGASAERAQHIRTTFRAAPPGVRRAFGMRTGDEPTFSIPCGLIAAAKPS